MNKLYIYMTVCLMGTSLGSCNKEELTLPETTKTVQTPVDEWLKTNYMQPYNVEVVYKSAPYNDPLFKNNIVPDVEKVKPAMQALKDLIINPLNDIIGKDFIKNNGPKFIQLYGAPNFNSLHIEDIATPLGGSITPLFSINYFDPENSNEVYRLCRSYTFGLAKAMLEKHPVDLEVFAKFNNRPYVKWASEATTDKGRYEDKDSNKMNFGFFTQGAMSSPLNDFCETFSYLICKDAQTINKAVYPEYVSNTTDEQFILQKKIDFVDKYLEKYYGVKRNADIARIIPRAISKYAQQVKAEKETNKENENNHNN